jgi:ferredoxin
MSRHAAVREARPAKPGNGDAALRIDPAVCDGVGICAHLAADLITVDSWGYPILRAEPLRSGSERRQAEAAVAACPRKALRITT